jgi:hypothetical protein
VRIAAIDRSNRELDDGERAPRRRQSPRTKGSLHFNNAPITTDEQNIDRELHEEGVDARTWSEHEPMTVGKRRPAQQTLIARRGFERCFKRVRDRARRAPVP